jgi:flagellar protein FliL
MADAPAKDQGPSLVMLIVVLLLLTLVGAGTGFAVGALLGKPAAPQVAAPAEPDPKPAEKKSEAKPAEAKSESAAAAHGGEGEAAKTPAVTFAPPVEAEVPTIIVPLQPMITNLAAPEGAWIRVEGSLIAKAESVEKPEVLAETMSAGILAYLRTLRLSQIEGASGFLAFRDDLDDLVKTASNGDVRKVLIKSLVVE